MAMNAYSHTCKFICTYIFPGRHNFTDSLIPTEIHLLLDRKRHSTVWRRLKSSNNLFFTCTWVWYFPKPSWNLSTHKSRGFILSLKWTSVLFPIIQHPFTLLLLTALWQFPYKITTCVILTLCALCRGDFSPPPEWAHGLGLAHQWIAGHQPELLVRGWAVIHSESMTGNTTWPWKGTRLKLLRTFLPASRAENEANVGDSSGQRWRETRCPMTYEPLQSLTPALYS